MNFQRKEPNENLDIARWESTQGNWQLGIRQVLFGVRVALYKTGNQWWTLDYCAGDDESFALLLLAVVAAILEKWPEEATERQFQDYFPRFEVKPINNDPACWEQLQALAGFLDLSNIPQFVCPHCQRTTYNAKYMELKFCRYESCHTHIDAVG